METEEISFAEKLRWLAQTQPDAPAVSCGGAHVNYREFNARTDRLARALHRHGVKSGDLVTLALPNSVGFAAAAWAIWKLGATPQPVSFRLPRPELLEIVELAATPLVIGDFAYDINRPVFDLATLVAEGGDEGMLPQAAPPLLKAPTSGGSTGRPKLILSTARAVTVREDRPIGPWGIRRSDVVFVPAPLYHNAGFMMMYATIGVGAHLVLAERFNPEQCLDAIQACRATWVYLVPTMMSRIWHLPDAVRHGHDLSSVRALWHFAAPCPPWLKEAFIEWFGPDVIRELYSGTESQARAFITGREWLFHRGSVGRVIMGQMKIFDQEGHEAALGEIGEIYMRTGEGAPPAYHYRGAEPRTLPGGWESLGDMGRFDDEGYLYLADRRTDMILVGGSNVYPAEIEAALESHPAVQSCAVIGLPDDDLGNRLHAIIQLRTPTPEKTLREHLAECLVTYKLPRSYEFVSEALRDEAGKIRRSALRAERLPSTSQA